MSKQNLTEKSIINSDPVPTLCAALRVLGQPLPEGILESDIDSFWEWAIKNWRAEAVPAGKAAPYPVDF
jgi:glutamyl-Q tRNA(Asp) synthetase